MQYKYKGHTVDVFVSLFGYIAYLDGDLEPQDISEDEYVEIIMNGKFIGV